MKQVAGVVLVTASSLATTILAIHTTLGSSCASVCLDSADGRSLGPSSSTTNTSNIVCDDVDYFSTATGVTFKKCMECLQTSKQVNGSESDSAWFLYNLRYASAVCLFDFPEHEANSTASCDLSTACHPLQSALETDLDRPTGSNDFSYCTADGSAFHGTNIDNCASCLQSSPGSYVANFILSLEAGCQQQPSPGVLLGVVGDIFSEYPVNMTTASSNSTSSSTSDDGENEVLSPGAIAGIGIGAAALFALGAGLFFIYWRKQKQYEREDRAAAGPSHFYGKGPSGGSGSYMVDLRSASSGYSGPQYTTDHKSMLPPPPPSYVAAPPAAAQQQQQQSFEMDYTNNAEYYDRLEGKTRGRPLAGVTAAVTAARGLVTRVDSVEDFNSADHVDATALPAHPAYIPRDRMVPSRLGSNSNSRAASRNSTPSVQSEPRFASRPDPYTIQVYMSGVDDAAKNPTARQQQQQQQAPPSQHPGPGRPDGITREASPRNIRVELAGPPGVSASRPSISDSLALRQGGGRVTPIPPQGGRTTPIPPQGGRTTPIPPSSSSQSGGRINPAPAGPSPSLSSSSPEPDTFGTGAGSAAAAAAAPPRIPSLILPSMPRIRVPSKKPPRLVITGASPVEDITGPLAFPDSRFSTRPPPPPPPPGSQQDRIIEQTVDRGAGVGRPGVDVPIGSGKSYLYG